MMCEYNEFDLVVKQRFKKCINSFDFCFPTQGVCLQKRRVFLAHFFENFMGDVFALVDEFLQLIDVIFKFVFKTFDLGEKCLYFEYHPLVDRY